MVILVVLVIIVLVIIVLAIIVLVVILSRSIHSSNFIDPDGNGDVVIRRLEMPRVRQSCQRLLPCCIWRGREKGL